MAERFQTNRRRMSSVKSPSLHLPITPLLPELVASCREHRAVILQAPPGAGKTTAVPLALWHAGLLGDKRLIMLEPRRLAARNAAAMLARNLGERTGETVGYRTRLDTRIGHRTRVEVVTEGILIRMLQHNPGLEGVGMVVFDEFHERSLQADLGLALTREVQDMLRDDLRLLMMSATLDVAPLARLLGDAPVLQSEGRSFPVRTHYWPPGRSHWLEHLQRSVLDLLSQESGSMLVFLPGAAEIRRLARNLEGRLPPDAQLEPLSGNLTTQAQDAAIAPASEGRRKVVLATSIAQTSLTIEGITVVVDAGYERLPVFDPNSAMTRLVTQRVSAAAADQRRGRAGRLAPGNCYRLWSAEEVLRPFSPPEMLQADLSGLVLELARWGARSPDGLIWLDPPRRPAWEQATQLLQNLDALTSEGALTAMGEQMLETGLPPRLGHMLKIAQSRGQGQLGAELAALLSERDLLGSGQSVDLRHRLALLRNPAGGGPEQGRISHVQGLARRLAGRYDMARPDSGENVDEKDDEERLGEVLAVAYPDRVARRRPGKAARYQLANGRGAFLDEGDPLGDAAWLVVADMDGQARESRIYLAAAVSPEGLWQALRPRIREHESCDWDERGESLVARREHRLGALCLDRENLPAPQPAQVTGAILDRLRRTGLEVLPWSAATRQWQARVSLLREQQHAGRAGQDWPDVSDAALAEALETWLGPFLLECRRWSDLSRISLEDALTSLLTYEQQQSLAAEAPIRVRVPTGQEIALDYTGPGAPVLAVKLQAVFGWQASPRVAFGQIPVTLHLLSPARRPTAVTQDLASFWVQGYPQVRKELRGRYPKHPWPEDPHSAQPQQGVTRKPQQKS